jgi:hypothetical protein
MMARRRMAMGSWLMLVGLAPLVACDGDAGGDAGDSGAPTDTADSSGGDGGDVAATPTGAWSMFGDAIRRQNAGSTMPEVVVCGGQVLVHWIFNRGLGQTVGKLVQGDGATWSEIGSYLNSPLVTMACGADGALYLVEEEHQVSGSFPNATHFYRYHARRRDGDAWVELGVIREGRDATYAPRLVSAGGEFYFIGREATGLVVRVRDGEGWSAVSGADPVPGSAELGGPRREDVFDDGRSAWVALASYTNGIGTGAIVAISGRAATTRYSGAVDLNRDRRWLALGGELYALRYEGGTSGIVSFPDGASIATLAPGEELDHVARVGDAFIGVVFVAPAFGIGDIVQIAADGRLTSLGRESSDAAGSLWSLPRSKVGRVLFFEHAGRPHAASDFIVAGGAVNAYDLVVLRHDP